MTSKAVIPISILLVDDEAPFVETMTKRLTNRELKVQSALSGQGALDALADGSSSKTDVVILDVKMPGMDGLETLEQIKTLHPLVEVIMLTGHATIENAIEGMKTGAYDYLMKPCDMDLLMAKIDEAVGKKREHEAKILDAKVQAYALKHGVD